MKSAHKTWSSVPVLIAETGNHLRDDMARAFNFTDWHFLGILATCEMAAITREKSHE
jgi:hypothetical protein